MKFVTFAIVGTMCMVASTGCSSGPGGPSNAEMISRYNRDLPPDTGQGPGSVSPERPIMPGKKGGK